MPPLRFPGAVKVWEAALDGASGSVCNELRVQRPRVPVAGESFGGRSDEFETGATQRKGAK